MTLRDDLIKLAYRKPELRGDLLPLLKTSAWKHEDWRVERVMNSLKAITSHLDHAEVEAERGLPEALELIREPLWAISQYQKELNRVRPKSAFEFIPYVYKDWLKNIKEHLDAIIKFCVPVMKSGRGKKKDSAGKILMLAKYAEGKWRDPDFKNMIMGDVRTFEEIAFREGLPDDGGIGGVVSYLLITYHVTKLGVSPLKQMYFESQQRAERYAHQHLLKVVDNIYQVSPNEVDKVCTITKVLNADIPTSAQFYP